jgi:hypothetical protein
MGKAKATTAVAISGLLVVAQTLPAWAGSVAPAVSSQHEHQALTKRRAGIESRRHRSGQPGHHLDRVSRVRRSDK